MIIRFYTSKNLSLRTLDFGLGCEMLSSEHDEYDCSDEDASEMTADNNKSAVRVRCKGDFDADFDGDLGDVHTWIKSFGDGHDTLEVNSHPIKMPDNLHVSLA